MTGMMGAGLSGSALDMLDRITPFPEACATRVATIPGPAGWVGRTLVFVTDVHYGRYFGPSDAERLCRAVADKKPDAIVLGGDLADAPDTDLGGFLEHLPRSCPVVFAPGNHDMAPGEPDSPVLAQLRRHGVTVLVNAAETWDGVALVGLPSALRLEQRTALLDTPGLKLVLAHEPDVWAGFRQPDLVQLAGHTHGGQVRVFNRPIRLPALGKLYPLGLYFKEGNNRLIVSAGIGCTTAPVRFNCPPEVVKLTFT